jgi:hypothetical protein
MPDTLLDVEDDLQQVIQAVLPNGPEIAVFLLAFLLAIFVVLVFAVRALMIVRKLPVPTDPLNMARPRAFRTLMLAAAALLTPLIARGFLPVEGLDANNVLVVSYGVVAVLGILVWLALEGIYRLRT